VHNYTVVVLAYEIWGAPPLWGCGVRELREGSIQVETGGKAPVGSLGMKSPEAKTKF